MDPEDGRAVVRLGYDRIAERFTRERIEGFTEAERAFLERVAASIPVGGVALDLGCGAGEPVTARLARRCRTIGSDLSFAQLAIARRHLPDAALVQADMARLEFREASLDAVVAFWSVIHLPRELHAPLFERVAAWLRPGGVFAGVMGTDDNPDEREPDWLGAPMYWSHFDAGTTLRLLRDAGFTVEHAERLPGGLPTDERGPTAVLARVPAA